jgi:general secretion pathway protein G
VSSHERRGFTLLELLVALSIVAALAAVVGPTLFGHVADGKRTAARTQVDALVMAIEAFRLDVGRVPSAQEGLGALRAAPGGGVSGWRGPYLKRDLPRDPWGQAYQYTIPGGRSGDAYDVYSFGRDGRVGGEGDATDIGNWTDAAARP